MAAVRPPLQVRQFIAGFFDGDGCVSMVKPCPGRPKGKLRVSFAQSCSSGAPPELTYLRDYYGGTMCATKMKASQRDAWQLHVQAVDSVKTFLEDVKDCTVMKIEQVQLALKYLEQGRPVALSCYEKLRDAKKRYGDVRVDESRLTDAYIAGLFAADGQTGIYGEDDGVAVMRARIDRECNQLLHAIQRKYGVGTVQESDGHVMFYASNALKMLTAIDPYLIGQKKPQVALAIEFQTNRQKGCSGYKSSSEREYEERIAKEIKRLKKT